MQGLTHCWRLKNKTHKNKLISQSFYNHSMKVKLVFSYNIKGLTHCWHLKNKTYKNKLESQSFYNHNSKVKLIFCALHKQVRKSNIP